MRSALVDAADLDVFLDTCLLLFFFLAGVAAFFFAVTAVFLTGFFWAVWFCAKGASEKVIAMMNNKIRFISYIKNPCSIISNS
ncbi:Uncharacterised protein [Segatella copri]|nr:Uncharacterised protein [Segatella copri]